MEEKAPQLDDFDYRLQSPFSYSIFGSSQSGKSFFIRQLLRKIQYVVDKPTSNKIVYFYQKWQTEFDDLIKEYPNMEFVSGIVTSKWLDENIGQPPKEGRDRVPLVVVDDGGGLLSPDTQKVFEVCVHHLYFNLIYSFHSLFSNKREHRSISLNSSYLHVQRNTRDISFVSVLSRQLEGPSKSARFVEIYSDATIEPYSYLVIDLRQTCPRSRQLRANILFEGNRALVVYERYD